MERGHESDACHDSVKYMGQKIPAFGLLDWTKNSWLKLNGLAHTVKIPTDK